MARGKPIRPRTTVPRRRRADVPKIVVPRATSDLTSAKASQFVRLLYAGLPPAAAVGYLHPELDEAIRKTLASRWVNSPLTLDATSLLMGGAKWESLDPSERLAIARDKFLAENAYLLYTHNLQDALDPDSAIGAGHLKSAYAVIKEHLDSRDADDDDPTDKFLKNLTLGKIPLDQPIGQMIGDIAVATPPAPPPDDES